MSDRFILPYFNAFSDVTGLVIPGARLFFYTTGTSNKKDTYSDAGLTTPNPNPVVANSAGRFGDIYLSQGDYKVVLAPAGTDDPPTAPIWTADPVSVPQDIPDASTTTKGIVELATVGETQSGTSEALAVTPAGLASVVGGEWTDLASQTTTSIGAALKANIRITGTTTITSFGAGTSGVTRQIRFADALILTHNASSLILPGGANITTAANDTAVAISLGSSNWIVTDYQRASGLPVKEIGGFEFISTVTATAAASLVIPGLTNTAYTQYMIVVENLLPATDDVGLRLQVSTDGGSSYQTSGYLSVASYNIAGSAGGVAATDGIIMDRSSAGANIADNGSGWSGQIYLFPRGTTYNKQVNYSGTYEDATARCAFVTGGGWYDGATDAVTHVRLITTSGNIASAIGYLYGLRNS
jgi:hypothetical protein